MNFSFSFYIKYFYKELKKRNNGKPLAYVAAYNENNQNYSYKKKERLAFIKNPITNWKPFKLETQMSSSLIEYPIN